MEGVTACAIKVGGGHKRKSTENGKGHEKSAEREGALWVSPHDATRVQSSGGIPNGRPVSCTPGKNATEEIAGRKVGGTGTSGAPIAATWGQRVCLPWWQLSVTALQQPRHSARAVGRAHPYGMFHGSLYAETRGTPVKKTLADVRHGGSREAPRVAPPGGGGGRGPTG